MKFITKRNIRYTIGAIFISIVGSFFWENLFRPGFGYLTNFVINISTLGLQTYKDDIYRQIAQNNHEYFSLETYIFF